MSRATGRTGTRLRASQVIEAAIAMPLLSVMLLACVGGSQLFRTQMLCEAASAEGARYAALHTEATDAEIAEWAKKSIGAEDDPAMEVSVSRGEAADTTYTMRIVDADGQDRSAEAKTESTAVRVKATLPVHVLGLTDFTAASEHAGIQSREALAR